MARDKLSIELDLNTQRASKEIAKLEKQAARLGKTLAKGIGGGPGGGADKVRALGTGLSKATVKADEFSKSLEASNARVIAFGASAGLIMNIDRALKAMVRSALQVEKAMMDVNVVMQVSNKELQRFGKGMFKVAKETAQSFAVVSEAGIELARQGLGIEKTLLRTKDALILTRLTGMNAADAVKTLTAAVNSFNKEGVTSAEVINRMAKVDAKFAVSSEDLAKSISRVGASAVSAGVSMNELMAITTAVQQRTARGGAVIGNAFKTIFTRIQRSDVQQRLENIGVATRDMGGKMLSGIKIVENLAKSFNGLTKAQQSSVSEQVAGVFQVNILKAAMADLSQANSVYAGSLQAANSATDEAYQKNEKLNQTLDSLVNKTLANLTQAGAALGGGMFGPAIENTLGTVNAIIDAFGDGGKFEEFGKGFGSDILKGMGKFIGGPGLIMVTAVFGKLALQLGKYATSALKDVVGISTATKQRAALEEAIVLTLQKEPGLYEKTKSGAAGLKSVQESILATMEAQAIKQEQIITASKSIAAAAYAGGARVGNTGGIKYSGRGAFGRGRPGGAGGFVPNFADAGSERAAAAAGGYTAGSIRTMSQPGAGTMMYNSAETVKRFPGMSQSAIMPPQGSPAGAGYRAAFGASHGFDPYAAAGFVPNFGRAAVGGLKRLEGGIYAPAKSGTGRNKLTPKNRSMILKQGGDLSVKGELQGGISMLTPDGLPADSGRGKFIQGTGIYSNFRSSVPIRSYDPDFLAEKMPRGPKDIIEEMKKAAASVVLRFAKSIDPPARKVEKGEVMAALDSTKGAKGALTAAAGAGFEVGMNLSLDAKAAEEEKLSGDFDLRGEEAAKTHRIFGGNYSIADYKASRSLGNLSSMTNKMAKELMDGKGGSKILHKPRATGKGSRGGKALGFIPNFSPVTSAIGRELSAGVPASAIRVGSSPTLRGAGNPGGIGVYNTIHEPAGLSQGIRRSQRSGIDPMTHGAASGFVPNFMVGGHLLKGAKGLGSKVWGGAKAAGKGGAGMGAMGLMGAFDNPFVNIASTTAMGAAFGGGLPGAGLGLVLGVITESIKALSGPSEEATDAIDEQVEAEISLAEKAKAASEGFAALNKQLTATEFISKKSAIIQNLGIAGGVGGGTMAHTPELKALVDADQRSFGGALSAFEKRAGQQARLSSVDFGPTVATPGRGVGGAEGKQLSAHLQDPTHLAKVAKAEKEFREFQTRVVPWIRTPVADEMTGEMDYSMTTQNPKLRDPQWHKSREGRRYRQLQAGTVSARVGGVGSFYANKFVEGISTPGEGGELSPLSPTARYQAMAAQGGRTRVTPATTRQGMEENVSRLLGVNVKDFRKGEYGDLRSSLASQVGTNQITEEDMDKELRAFLSSVTRIYNSSEEYNKAVQALSKEKKNEGDVATKYIDILRETMKAQEAYRQEVLGSKRALASLTRSVAQDKAMFGIDASYRTAKAGTTMTRRGAVGVTRDIALERAELNRKGAISTADQAYDTSIKEGLKGLDAVKFMEGEKLGAGQAKMALDAFTGLRKSAAGGDREGVNAYIEQLADVKGIKLQKGVFGGDLKGIEQQVAFKNLGKVIAAITKAEEKHILAKDAATETETNAIALAKEKHKIDLKTLELAYKINTQRRQESREIEASLKAQELGEATRLTSRGQMGMRGRASAFEAARAARISAHGVGKGEIGAAFQSGFGGEMGYGVVDSLDDLRDGSRQVAQSMKSSFADAFQSIASGASSASDAIFSMAQSILNSISQVSTNMFTNMLFDSAFPQRAHGGLIPGYAGGGVVTGGSGYKDDVMTRMQGGEYVIKKSAAQKIGYGTLNAINSSSMPGYAEGGPTLGQTGLVAAGASAAAGLIGSLTQEKPDKPLPSRDYGFGRGQHGYFGGADPDAGQVDRVGGGGGRAAVSLSKGYVFYRRDPQTGRLISERARPTEGRFEVSSSLSLLGRLGDDPQTSRMFGKEESMAKYTDYLVAEAQNRKDQIAAAKKRKRGALIQGYANAAMMIGGSYLMGKMGGAGGSKNPYDPNYMEGIDSPYAGTNQNFAGYSGTISSQGGVTSTNSYQSSPFQDFHIGGHGSETLYDRHKYQSVQSKLLSDSLKFSREFPGNANGGLAKVMGGEYVMSPEAVRTYGTSFMGELNRGNVPGYANGGPVGGVSLGNQGTAAADAGSMMGGNTTNNVKISVNIDKAGKAEAQSDASSSPGGDTETDEMSEVENNKALGELLQTVVLEEIVKQQRPGGLLR